jgi:hypothetical protein
MNSDEPIHPTMLGRGLTKRELFAAMAMQGMVVSDTWVTDGDAPEIARRCVLLADALLVALSPSGSAQHE